MFIDEAKIKIKAGDGGTGLVSFRHERYVAKGGPDGGDGGNGGSIFFVVNSNLNTLSNFRRLKNIGAESGKAGGKNKMHGKKGKDLFIDIPPGTVVVDAKTNEQIVDLTNQKEPFLAVKGGKGGFGNAHFTTSVRQVPDFAQGGLPGEEIKLKLILKLIADIGIIGMPNVGKSTLLSRISEAKPKIANYPFTTLVPNLGIVKIDDFSFVASDVPGLIKDAYKGKGLGDKFLKHIERCRLIIHILDATNPDMLSDFQAINKELKLFSAALTKKPQIVVVNKIDAADIKKIKQFVSKNKIKVESYISAVTGEGISKLLYIIKEKLLKLPKAKTKIIQEIKVFKPYEKLFKIEKRGTDFYIIGKEIEDEAMRTDFENFQAKQRFVKILTSKGIMKQLEKSKIERGQNVYFGNKKLRYPFL